MATLAGLTLLGGVLRFMALDRPGLWYDEAQTYRRVCGSFAQMMQELRPAGFMPLHYWMEWGLAQILGGAEHLTPFWLRLIPAVAGTLMVPAIYWLALQLASRHTALAAAAFAACSAFVNYYSRDAKMYMPLWLMCTLSMASLLAWLRAGKAGWWCAWVATSMAMTGLHAAGLVVLGLEAFAYLVYAGWGRRRQLLPAFLGVVLIGAGPLAYYVGFNRWAARVHESGWTGASGLHWVPFYNAGRTRAELIAYATSAYLTGWEWPADPARDHARLDKVHRLSRGATHGYYVPRAVRIAFESVNRMLIALAALGGMCALGVIRRRSAEDRDEWTWRRNALILGIWTVVPPFAFFEVATNPISASSGATAAVGTRAAWLALIPLTCASLIFVARRVRDRAPAETATFSSDVPLLLIPATLCAAVAAIVHLARIGVPGWGGVWVPRYMGFVWPAGAVALCGLLVSIRPRALRWGAIGSLLAVNVCQSLCVIWIPARPPIGRMVEDAWASRDPAGSSRAYFPAGPLDPEVGDSVFESTGKYYLSMTAGRVVATPATWNEVPAKDLIPLRWQDDPRAVAADILQHPGIRRIVVWQDAVAESTWQRDELAELLGRNWTKASQAVIPVRFIWNWSHVYSLRRCEYVKS